MVVAPGRMLDNLLPIPDAESLPFYRMVLKLARDSSGASGVGSFALGALFYILGYIFGVHCVSVGKCDSVQMGERLREKMQHGDVAAMDNCKIRKY